eukprot:721950-Pelagomonas_calceolata.AAC.1
MLQAVSGSSVTLQLAASFACACCRKGHTNKHRLVDAGEDIHTAAEREVQEETGIRTTFDSVLAVRQAHGFGAGKSGAPLIFLRVAFVSSHAVKQKSLEAMPAAALALKTIIGNLILKDIEISPNTSTNAQANVKLAIA